MDATPNQRLEYLYKEYVRLNDKAEDLINSTYDDFKSLGVVGAVIIVWKPIPEIILPTIPKLDSSLFLFLVFLSLLIILGLVALSNLIKQSYSWYFVYNLQAYEVEIKKELREAEDSRIFNFNLGKGETRFIIASYRLTFRTFVLSFASFITFVPFVILCYSSVFYAVLYLSISLIGFLAYLQIFKRVLKQYSSNNFLL
ncbi:MAG: hypothetical protein EDM05_60500 [Leptolyngbya sp. IPPAS B-1204]|nr:hypothetical protein [Elainella sp. C42_A2020_010]RNJ67282.1 MAG: hypothetical protein EDM05_21110 [Leptolyngbya sp. IPPAS B-1204]